MINLGIIKFLEGFIRVIILAKNELLLNSKFLVKPNSSLGRVFLFIMTFFTINIYPQKYNFKNFSSENGLAQNYIYSIIQDKKGYLWSGTGNGLSRYNGFVFENYTVDDSLADNFITCMIDDGESLWLGHMNGKLSYYDGKEMQTFNMQQLNLSTVTHFSKSPEKTIWASTYSDGLVKLGETKNEIKHYSFKEDLLISSFYFLDEKELLVSTDEGVFYCMIKGSGEIEIIRRIKEIPESKVSCIQKMKNGQGFYIATENDGLFKLTVNDKLFEVSNIVENLDLDISGIQYILEDSQLNLWIATVRNGLVKLNYSKQSQFLDYEYFNESNGYGTDYVKTIFEDREGIIWVGNYGFGLTQITPKTFITHSVDYQEIEKNFLSFYFDKKYKWIGTENGLIKMDQKSGEILKFYGKVSGLPSDPITSIYSIDGKEIWIGTGENGVFRMQVGSEQFYKLSLAEGELENAITSISGDKEQLWIGTKKGLCNINLTTNDKKWYSISNGGLPHNTINSLHFDTKKRLWVTTLSSTVACIKSNKVFKVPLNITGQIITLGPITEDKDSLIWVGSSGSGIFRIDSDSIANFTTKEGLFSNFCYSLICDIKNNIWIGHKGGLSRIRAADFSIKAIQNFESETDNYQFNPNACTKDYEEKLWFGANNAIISYDPRMEYSPLKSPVLGITSIKINDETKEISEEIILSPGKYKIRFDFLGISLKEPTLVTYQYKLDGYEEWSEITKSTNITYNNLNDGDYAFILKASSGDGAVSEVPLIINIRIKKPIWKKWWFYVLLGITLITLTILYIKRREYQLKQEKKNIRSKSKGTYPRNRAAKGFD